MKTWMEAFIRRMRQAFGDRLAFVGLQGSRARGEATPKSDIDVVVVLDRLCLLYTSSKTAGRIPAVFL